MKRTIRIGVFETNSSSTHSLTMCSEEDYNGWKDGLFLFDEENGSFVAIEDVEDYKKKTRWCDLKTYTKYWDIDLEGFKSSYTTNSGEKVVAFGYYGYDG